MQGLSTVDLVPNKTLRGDERPRERCESLPLNKKSSLVDDQAYCELFLATSGGSRLL